MFPDHDRFADDGNPHYPLEPENRPLFTLYDNDGFLVHVHRQHKTAVHLGVVALIAASLVVERTVRPADWLFVVLSILVERT